MIHTMKPRTCLDLSEVVIKGVETAEEQEAVNELITKVHYADYFSQRMRLDAFIANYPEYLREHTRLAVVHGQVVSCLCLFTHTVRIGEARMRLGGIGYVTTAGPWRQKGYAALLMDDAIRYMKMRGYHLSMLFGIADFYHRWGFASVLPDYASIITLGEAGRASRLCVKERRMKPGDIPAVLGMHNRGDADTSCSIIRSAAHFNNRWEQWKEARILTNTNGNVIASFVGRVAGEEYLIEELNAMDKAFYPAILHACLIRARNEYTSRMRFSIPPSHPFTAFLRQYRTDHEMHVYRNSNGMVSPVNIEEILECMTAEWEYLLSSSSLKDMAAVVTLVIDNIPYRIRSHHGMIDILPCPGENKLSISSSEFVQLLTGYRHIEEILVSRRRAIRAPAKSLLEIIFPKRTPYVWPLDRF